MDITDTNEAIVSFETVDPEPWHYFAFYRSGGCGWNITYIYPMTDKQKLIDHLQNGIIYYEHSEARIMKARLPLG